MNNKKQNEGDLQQDPSWLEKVEAVQSLVKPVCHPLRDIDETVLDLRAFWVWIFSEKSLKHKELEKVQHQLALEQWFERCIKDKEATIGFKSQDLLLMELNGQYFHVKVVEESLTKDSFSRKFRCSLREVHNRGSAFERVDQEELVAMKFVKRESPERWVLSTIEQSELKQIEPMQCMRRQWLEEYQKKNQSERMLRDNETCLVVQEYGQEQEIERNEWRITKNRVRWLCVKEKGSPARLSALDHKRFTNMVWPQRAGEKDQGDPWSFVNRVPMLKKNPEGAKLLTTSPVRLSVDLLATAQLTSNAKKNTLLFGGATEALRTEIENAMWDSSGVLLVESEGEIQCFFEATPWAKELIEQSKVLIEKWSLIESTKQQEEMPGGPNTKQMVERRKKL